jgi:muramoyltetrapeptide carboxypeptidase
MTILIDPPAVVGHGRLWSHLASDASYDELHAFASATGIPSRGFDRDHYDVPAEFYDRMVEAGAVPVSSRELLERLARGGLRRRKSGLMRPRSPGRTLLLPPQLQPGDTVAVVAPAGPADRQRLADGLALLRSWGLVVRGPRPGGSAAAEPGVRWLAGSDEERAAALTAAWLDPAVKAVLATRGGFGSQRLLDLLDWRTLARERDAAPAWLVGFSDVTALHQAFASRVGVATVHGPGVTTLPGLEPAALDAVRALLFEHRVEPMLGDPAGVPGEAAGVLVGGNLTVLAASAGTTGVHPARDSVALLEDVNEAPYRLDRSLTQLLRSGWLEGVRGVALGRFTDCGDPEEVRRMLVARLEPLGVPVVDNLPVGHVAGTRSVVLGRRVGLDGRSGRLTQDLSGSAAG